MELTAHPLLTLAAILVYNISLTLGQRIPTTTSTTPTVDLFLSGHSGSYPSGADATLVCEVTNLNPTTMIISISRTRSGSTTTLLYNEVVPNSAPTNMQYLGSFDQVGSVWKIIKLTGVTQEDAGVFTCTLISTERNTALDSHSIDVQVQYVPTPICSVAGRASVDTTYTIGEEVTFVCVSELGVPTASLLWGVSGNGPPLPDRETTTGTDSITTVLPLMMTSDHNGATYSCFSFSGAGNTLSCAIGPLIVVGAGTSTPAESSTLQPKTKMTTIAGNEVITMKSTSRVESSPTTLMTTTSNSSPKVSANTGLTSSTVAAICVILILILIAVVLIVYLVRTRRCDGLLSKRKTTHGQSNGKSGLQAAPAASLDAEHAYYNTAQDTASVQHVQAPSGGALYAVVEKPKSVRHPEANGRIPNNNHEEGVGKNQSTSPKTKDTVPVVYSNLNEISGTESPKREKSTTTTAVPCTDDSTRVGLSDIEHLEVSSISCSDNTNDNGELPVYAKVNKHKSEVLEEPAASSDQERDEHSPTKDLNVEGLLYADLNLVRPPRNKTDTIISTDEPTIYADIGVLNQT